MTSWGLQRISSRKSLSRSLNIVEGVDVYAIDTGIDVEHDEFENRANWKSFVYGKKA